MKTNPNDSIYQHKEEIDVRGLPLTHNTKGLTKLEYFAGLAMQGIIASGVDHDTKENVCKVAIVMAKALITELNNQHEK